MTRITRPGESFLPIRIRKGVRQRAVMRSEEWHDLCLSKENKNEPGKPVSFIRLHKDAAATWLSRLLPAAIFILVGLFSIMVIRDYGRESCAAPGRRCWKREMYSFALWSPARE